MKTRLLSLITESKCPRGNGSYAHFVLSCVTSLGGRGCGILSNLVAPYIAKTGPE